MRGIRGCCCIRSITGPNGWDHVPAGSRIPRGESSMWGDYHLREAALYVKRIAEGAPYYTFFGGSRYTMQQMRNHRRATEGREYRSGVGPHDN